MGLLIPTPDTWLIDRSPDTSGKSQSVARGEISDALELRERAGQTADAWQTLALKKLMDRELRGISLLARRRSLTPFPCWRADPPLPDQLTASFWRRGSSLIPDVSLWVVSNDRNGLKPGFIFKLVSFEVMVPSLFGFLRQSPLWNLTFKHPPQLFAGLD